MNDAELEALLREVALEEREPVDPRWEAYTRGELSEEEAAALVHSDPEKAELFRPLPVEPVLASLPAPEPVRAANRPWGWAVLAGLLAAAVLIFLLLPGSPPLPSYEITVSGGLSEVRSTPTKVPVLAPGAPVVIRLRPATRTEAEIDVQVFAGDERMEAVEVKSTSTGAIEVVVRKAPAGTTLLLVVLGWGDADAQRFEVPIVVK